jgi:hypothetical protein
MYFKRKEDIINLSNYKIFFLNAQLLNDIPFITGKIPAMNYEPDKQYITNFINEYELIKNQEIIDNINKLKSEKPIFGIHMRSYAQKKIHNLETNMSIENKLIKLKEKLDLENNDYSIFIASDVNSYINYAKSIFKKDVYFIENTTRVDNDEYDIISYLGEENNGYKLGSDILFECLAMSICDKVYVTISNIQYLISIMNPNIIMEEY